MEPDRSRSTRQATAAALVAFFFAVAGASHSPFAFAGGYVPQDPEGDNKVTPAPRPTPGDWTQILPPTTPTGGPGARCLHTAIYDPDADRMVVFGGIFFSNAYADVWTSSLTSGAWQQLSLAPGPSGRRDHIAVYDSARKRMLIYGGSGYYDGALGDVWALSLGASPAWSQVVPAGPAPPARFSHAGIYDPVRDRLIAFGGYTGFAFDNGVWALSLSGAPSWSLLTPAGTPPSPRDAMTAVYDPVRDRMLIFGGWAATSFDGKVWALSLAGTPTWSVLATSGVGPSPRRHYSAVYDAAGDRLVVWGGLDAAGYHNDVYALNLGGAPTWTALAPSGGAPPARNEHRAVYDPVRGRLVTFGGYGDSGYLDDLWALSLAGAPAWTQLVSEQPAPVRDHVSVYDSARRRMVVFGGSSFYDGPNSNTWALSLSGGPEWSSIHAAGGAPPARFSHAGMYDPVRDRLIVFGGWSGSAFLNDLWALGFAGTPTWAPLAAAGTPPSPRDAMSTIYDSVHDRLLLFGGWAADHFTNDLWQLSLAGTPAWSLVSATGTPPSPRRHYAAQFDPAGNRLVLVGGLDASGYRNDVWTLTFDAAGNGTWAQQNPSGSSPSPRNGHRMVLDAANNRMLMFGGYDGGYRNDLWELSLKGKLAWHEVRPGHTFVPDARMLHTLVFDPGQSRMILFGGLNQGVAMSEVWSFDASQAQLSTSGDAGPGLSAPPGAAPHAEFGLAGASPNPSWGPFDVRFSLPDARPATLSVFSVAGRELLRREVGALGPGEHVLSFRPGAQMAPGVYLVRLRGADRAVDSKVVIAAGR